MLYARLAMTTAHTGPRIEAETLAEAVAALRERGLRLSGARRVVLEALYTTDQPLSAEQIAEGAGGTPASDLASVYRNLETLERLGLVQHVHLGHGAGRYVRAGREREYLVCERCGANRAVPPAQLDGVRAAVERATGFQARFSHFPIVGLCGECAARPPA
jgi:Fur family ferric uptake transcriptional regulator